MVFTYDDVIKLLSISGKGTKQVVRSLLENSTIEELAAFRNSVTLEINRRIDLQEEQE